MRSFVLLLCLVGCGGSSTNSPPDAGPSDAGAPEAPANVTATTVSFAQIDVDWTVVAGAASYDVYQATEGGVFARVGTSITPPFAATGLAPSTTYRFVVRAVGSDGRASADSSEATATTAAGPPCYVPFTHATVANALADVACPEVTIATGTYTERVTIARDVIVRGVGTAVLDGEAGGSVVTITSDAAAVVLEDLTIRNGLAPRGGGLLVHGGATLRRVRVEDNVAESELVGEGGGIYCDHVELVLEDTTVTGNRASLTDSTTTGVRVLGGGGVFHQGDRLRITGGAIEQNRVTSGGSGRGGGLVMDQSNHEWGALTELTVDGTTIRGNTIELTGSNTRGMGGGVYVRFVDGPESPKMALANVRLEENRVVANGGVGGGLACHVEFVYGGSPIVEIAGSTVAMNRLELATGSGSGGGIAVFDEGIDSRFDLKVIVDRSRITGNEIVGGNTISGGGLSLDHGFTGESSGLESRLSITRSEIAGNELQGSRPNGAGIYYECHICNSHLDLSQSTVSGNRSIGSQDARNGGVATEDIIDVSIVDSTISSNEARSASGAARGGGIGAHSHEISSLHMASSTITANLVTGPDAAGGGIYFDVRSDEGTQFEDLLMASLANTIVAQNTGGDCAADVDPWAFYEARSTGYNLFGTMGTCNVITGTGDQLGANAQLLPLADNGGATKTHALGASSPARDRGDPAGCKASDGTVLAVDQRDLARVANGRCDVGSVEAQ